MTSRTTSDGDVEAQLGGREEPADEGGRRRLLARRHSLLEQGKISGVVVQNPYGMGKKTVELIVAASKGENPAEKNVVSESVWVTTENLNDPDVQQIVN